MYRELEEPRDRILTGADADMTAAVCICACREPQPAAGREAAPTVKSALDLEVRENIG